MERINLAAKAFRAALKELRWTLLILLVIGAPIVSILKLGGLAAFGLAIFLTYTRDFELAYRKAYTDLVRSNVVERVVRPATRSAFVSSTPQPASSQPAPPPGKRPIGRWLRRLIITLVSGFGLWLLFNLCVWIYR
jgi:hypothetical protein